MALPKSSAQSHLSFQKKFYEVTNSQKNKYSVVQPQHQLIINKNKSLAQYNIINRSTTLPIAINQQRQPKVSNKNYFFRRIKKLNFCYIII